MTVEFHAWPPRPVGGQQVTKTSTGVLAIDVETGVAVYVGTAGLATRESATCRGAPADGAGVRTDWTRFIHMWTVIGGADVG